MQEWSLPHPPSCLSMSCLLWGLCSLSFQASFSECGRVTFLGLGTSTMSVVLPSHWWWKLSGLRASGRQL